MSRKLVLPFFPVAPQQYDPTFMSEVIRAFSVFLDQYQNPGDARNTTLTLTNLQTDDLGLEVGSVFEYRDVSGMMGNLKIVTADRSHTRGNSATGAVGSVTITT